MKKLHYKMGDVFAMPLCGGTYCSLGVIAGMSVQGKVLLGYFYKDIYTTTPPMKEIAALTAGGAARIWRFGDLSLYNREWPIVGHVADFDKQQWPSAKFLRESIHQLITYSNDDPMLEIQVAPYSPDGNDYEKDGIKGAELVEIAISRIAGLTDR